MIIINRVFKSDNTLYCDFSYKDIENTIFIKPEEQYADYLCDDRADSFFIILMYKAIREGCDLISKVVVSERLYYQATTFMNTILSKTYGTREVSIKAPITTIKLPSANAVATGMTGGIDSLYTIMSQSQDVTGGYLLTHLVLLNVGSHNIGVENSSELFNNRIKLARDFSEEHGYNFVLIDSNIHDFLPFNYTSYYGIINCATILAMQKLFKIYYSSSSYSITSFKLNPFDVAYFELFNMSMLSTDNTLFYSVGSEIDRYAKTKYLTKYKPSYEYLNVCNSHSYNCSKKSCVKCSRTLITLDICDSLEKYSKVFDLKLYENSKMDYLADMYARKIIRKDAFAKEIWHDVRKKYKIPVTNKIRSLFQFILHRIKIYDLKQIRTLLKER